MSDPATLCSHNHLVDNHKEAEVTCRECGRVLDKIIGGIANDLGGGGGDIGCGKHVFYQRSEKGGLLGFPALGSQAAPKGEPLFCPPCQQSVGKMETYENDNFSNLRPIMEVLEDEDERDLGPALAEKSELDSSKQFQIETIISVIAKFRMNNYSVRPKVIENYCKIYASVPKQFLRKSEQKDNLAAAFAIVNTLARLGQPVPPQYICNFFELPNTGVLLDLPKNLGLSEEYLATLPRAYYELGEMTAADFARTLMDHMSIAFYIMNEVVALAKQLQKRHSGKQPTVLAAAAMQRVLSCCPEFEWPSCKDCDFISAMNCHTFDVVAKTICDALDCRQSSVNEVLRNSPPCMTWTSPWPNDTPAMVWYGSSSSWFFRKDKCRYEEEDLLTDDDDESDVVRKGTTV